MQQHIIDWEDDKHKDFQGIAQNKLLVDISAIKFKWTLRRKDAITEEWFRRCTRRIDFEEIAQHNLQGDHYCYKDNEVSEDNETLTPNPRKWHGCLRGQHFGKGL